MPDISLLALLFLALGLIFAAALVISRFDFLQPAVIGSGVMTVSAFFAVAGQDWWALSMSVEGWWIIVLAVAVFVVSGLWAYSASRPDRAESPAGAQQIYEVSCFWMIFFCLIMLVMARYSLQAMNDVAFELGNKEGYRGMLQIVRQAVELDEGYLFNRWMSYRAMAAQMIATTYLYIFLSNVIMTGWRWRFLIALPPVACYFPFLILSTGRMTMLCFVICGFVIAAVLYLKKYGYTMASRRRAIAYAVLAAAAFFALFFLMGMLTGKTGSGDRSYFYILAHYAGLSLPAFGEMITHPVLEDGLVGSHTLGAVYRILAQVGLPMPAVRNFMPFTDFSGIDTNVYTALWRYTWDFGIIGMLLMMFLLSAGFTLAYRYIRHGRLHPYALMAYATFVYPVFWLPMDDRLLMEIVNTTTLYDLVMLFILYELLIVHARKTSIPS